MVAYAFTQYAFLEDYMTPKAYTAMINSFGKAKPLTADREGLLDRIEKGGLTDDEYEEGQERCGRAKQTMNTKQLCLLCTLMMSCALLVAFILMSVPRTINDGPIEHNEASPDPIHSDFHGTISNISTPGHSTSSSNLTILHSPCGNTPASARAAGCIFDGNSFVWSHPRCHSAALAAEFMGTRDWKWYADASLSRELGVDDIMTGEYTGVHVTWEYHVHHCLFMWKLLHHQALGPHGRFGVDSYIGNFAHTAHCAYMLGITGMESGEVNTEIGVKFPDCGVEVMG